VKRAFRILFRTLLVLLILLGIVMAVAYALMRASLPTLDGSVALAGVTVPVSMTRDALGTVSIKAATSHDAMRALGFVHAQERFFEMDLTRRSAAGELSALLGKATIDMDKKKRVHRFRARMVDVLTKMDPAQRAGFDAYVAGVNTGLAQLSSRPWQYWVLRAEPEPWRIEDSLLVTCEMFYMLQAKSFDGAFDRARLRDAVAEPIFNWLQPIGGHWDAALDGSVIAATALPTAAELDVRNLPPATVIKAVALNVQDIAVGSNAWAIGGARTVHGGGMLADDMHLGHSVPNIWFRAQLEIGSERIVGVTLPGVASIVVGSNGHIAWGFTNSYGKWFDWVEASKEELNDAANKREEKIVVKGGETVILNFVETRAGPVMREGQAQGQPSEQEQGKSYALNWSAHDSRAVNADLAKLMFAKNVDEGLAIAQTAGMPHQNFHIVDKSGNVAWSIAGRMLDATGQPTIANSVAPVAH
jgi:penicillin G amidase